MNTRANRTFPLFVTMTPGGEVFVRCFVDRAVALQVIEARDDDEVYFIGDAGVRIEISFHESVAAADAALVSAVQRGVLAGTPARGRA